MSSLFVWDAQRYETKVAEMDNEHKKLVEIMNRLYTKNKEGAPKSELIKIVDELANWTITHFKHEEAFLEKIKFPGLTNHKGIHQRLLTQFTQHKNDFANSPLSKVSDKFFDFLTLWLSAHIQHIDMQYSPAKFKKTA